MKILILSVDHKYQIVPLETHTILPGATEETNKLRTLVNELIAIRSVDLICEESDPCYLSVAQREAFMHSPSIQWKNINMSAQERLERNVWEALLYRPQDIDHERGVTIDHRIPEDHVREHFFKDEIIKTAEKSGAKSVLVLCGDAHTEELKAKLEAIGYMADTNHDLIKEKNWK